jgi:hypothetical protein
MLSPAIMCVIAAILGCTTESADGKAKQVLQARNNTPFIFVQFLANQL